MKSRLKLLISTLLLMLSAPAFSNAQPVALPLIENRMGQLPSFTCEQLKTDLQTYQVTLLENHTLIINYIHAAGDIYAQWLTQIEDFRVREKVWPKDFFLFLKPSQKNLEKSSEVLYSMNETLDKTHDLLKSSLQKCISDSSKSAEILALVKEFAEMNSGYVVSIADLLTTMQSRLESKTEGWPGLENQQIDSQDTRFAVLQEESNIFFEGKGYLVSSSKQILLRLQAIVDRIAASQAPLALDNSYR